MDAVRNRVRAALDLLKKEIYSDIVPAEMVWISEGDYQFGEEFDQSKLQWREFEKDGTWGGKDRHYWFRTTVRPAVRPWQEVRVMVNTGASDIWNTDNPQIMVYSGGILKGTMDMNHQELILTACSVPGEEFCLAFYAYSNSRDQSNFFHIHTGIYNRETAGLYYDCKTPFEAADLLPEDCLERIETLKVLNGCISCLDTRCPGSDEFYASVAEARKYIKERYYDKRRETSVTVHSIGHTHIDVAWKWPLKQTRQKAVRSFQTVLELMERYPEYKFMSSQPQLYEFVKEEAPGLFERIREKVREGRWEAEGAMWLEPDCNLASGESLVRHILYGRAFFEGEMGAAANEVLWLPDVFGYSAALPQIMKKSGLSYFVTTKLGWNEYNQFPYDTFEWKGIDGSRVLTWLITTRDYVTEGEVKKKSPFSTTYNGRQNASQIMGTWQRYQNKDVSRELLTCYGYGDGGGGPTEEMLEEDRRLAYGVGLCPQTKQTFVKDFFHILEKEMDRTRLPVWNGELYLEYHRGTYTSMAKNKKYNRQCEFLNGDAEFYSVLAKALDQDFIYPVKELEKNWKTLLLNQFHDILPGSSIREVYEDSDKQYEAITSSGRRLVSQAQAAVLKKLGYDRETGAADGWAVWNPLSFSRSGIISGGPRSGCFLSQKAADGSVICLADEVASKGLRIYEDGEKSQKPASDILESIELTADGKPRTVTTPFYEVRFNDQGEMEVLYDRREKRSLFQNGEAGNRLVVYEDRPMEFDAWNIDPSYEEKSWKLDDMEEFRVLENGPVRGSLFIRRRYMESVVEQTVCFYGHTARIDFQTTVDWNQHQMLLKAVFPMDILCNEASYEIQFGNVKRPSHRNTTWDKARFEVCVHKWADVSEAGYGAALLNDCKYGMDIHDSVMRLTLIKSGIFPNPDADQGIHTFTYALFPHAGDYREGHVIREAYDLNCPLEAVRVSGARSASCSFLTIEEENILADTVKQSEDRKGIVIRLYEAHGKRTQVHFNVPYAAGSRAAECDLMEKEQETILCQDGAMIFEMKPYEIKTIMIRMEGIKGGIA